MDSGYIMSASVKVVRRYRASVADSRRATGPDNVGWMNYATYKAELARVSNAIVVLPSCLAQIAAEYVGGRFALHLRVLHKNRKNYVANGHGNMTDMGPWHRLLSTYLDDLGDDADKM